MIVTATTRIYAMLGHPIAQVRSPAVINRLFEERGIDAVLIPADVTADHLSRTVAGLMALENLHGLLVTIPHKVAILAAADILLPGSRRTGAANALRREADGRWSADMFDGRGFVEALRAKGLSVEGKTARVYGAGGAGMAIAVALADAGMARISLIDPEAGKARAVAARLLAACPGCRIDTEPGALAEAGVIVNASPAGMYDPAELPDRFGELAAGTLVGDVVIRPEPTALLALAARCGCPTVNGQDMHAGQVSALMAFFGF